MASIVAVVMVVVAKVDTINKQLGKQEKEKEG
jgi:hypothetical protein